MWVGLCKVQYVAMHNGIGYISSRTGPAMPVFSPGQILPDRGGMVLAYTDDIFSFSVFDPAKLTQSWREFAEKGASHSQDAYGKMKSAAEEASRTMESTIHSAQAGTVEMGLKAIDAFRENTQASLAHMESLMGAKSMSEVLELQTTYVRKQAELSVEQARGMQEAARKVADELSKPGQEAAEMVMNTFKPS
jgi:phasin